MNSLFYIAQIFGLFALVLSIISVTQKSRIKFIVCNSVQNLFSGLQYLMLNKITATILCFITIVRVLTYSLKSKFNKVVYILILCVFIVINLYISMITYKSWIDVFPIIASTLVCFTVWQTNLTIIRIGQIMAKLLWGIYAVFTLAYFAIIMDIFIIIWTIGVIIKSK